MAIAKPHNGGEWTEARKRSFVMSALRKAAWPPKFRALESAFVRRVKNPKTGRICRMYRCAGCGELFPMREMAIDHIEPVIPVEGHDSWDGVVMRLYVEKEGFQGLCKDVCHKAKTEAESAARWSHKRRSSPQEDLFSQDQQLTTPN